MEEQQENPGLWEKWKEFLYNIVTTKEWAIFITFARIGTFILLGIILYVLIKEIEAVKLLGYDACKICSSKTGAICTLTVYPGFN